MKLSIPMLLCLWVLGCVSSDPAFAFQAGESCSQLGQTALSDDKTTTVGCFKVFATQTDCGSDASPTCVYKRMTNLEDQYPKAAAINPEEVVKVSFELVGGGGGGGGNECCSVAGGSGGSAGALRFATNLVKGEQITVSVGSGGLGAQQGLGRSLGDGGSGLMGMNGGTGGGTGGGGDGVPGPSGIGGGGGAASVVIGRNLFAVAGGGGGGGGGSLYVAGGAADPASGGSSGVNGLDGAWGCNGRDGGGGGGGGGGYPAGAGGAAGCDSSSGGRGGNMGVSYYSLPNGVLANAFPANSAGAGLGGPAQTNGACGRVTIWSSTGGKFQFDCGGASPPMWIVQ